MGETLPYRPELDDTKPDNWFITFLIYNNEPDEDAWYAKYKRVREEVEKECLVMVSYIEGKAQLSVLQKGITQRHALYKSTETLLTACETFGLPFAIAGVKMIEESLATEAYVHESTPAMKDVTLHGIEVYGSIQAMRDAAEDL